MSKLIRLLAIVLVVAVMFFVAGGVRADARPTLDSWVLQLIVEEKDVDGTVTGEIGKVYYQTFSQYEFGTRDAAQTMAEYYGNNGVHLPFENPVHPDSPRWYYPAHRIHRIKVFKLFP